MKITQLQINKGQIEGLPANPRFIKDEKYKKLVKSIQENPEMLELRELLVYPYDGKYVIIGGNMRYRACKELGYTDIPVKIIPKTATVEQLRAYTIKDNNGFGDWDFDMLSNEWDLSELENWGVDFTNMDLERKETEIVEDEAPEVDEESEPMTKLGDVWQLGRHRLMCGDSTDKATVELLMDGEKADMVFTDPPYGMKKEKDGVLNDNLNFDDLLEFNKKWIPLTFANTKENGSWYCWGTDEPLMDIYSNILKPMIKTNKITFRNLITWDKGDAGAGGVSFMGKDGLRSYPISDEKCLFVMCGVQGFNNNKDHYDETFEPIRAYLEQEAKKAGLTSKLLTEITGVQMFCHWFTKSQFTIIPESHYKKLQAYYNGVAFDMPYDNLQTLFNVEQHETLREAVMAKRAYFDNTHDKMKTVWEFGRTKGKERELCFGHATPKPIALCSRAIKSSSRENEIVLDLFGGSGSTLIACEQLNRTCYMMELDPHYCDVIVKRWETLTGEKAVKIE